MSRLVAGLLVAFALIGCAGNPHIPGGAIGGRPPRLEVSALRKTPSGQQTPWTSADVLRANEPLTLQVGAHDDAYLSVVFFSPSGESEDLAGQSGRKVSAGTHLQFDVPRRAPPGVTEAELRLFVVASAQPLEGAARGLLRLPCGTTPDTGKRGDRTDDAPQKEAKSEEKKSNSSSGKPDEGDRKGPGDTKLCASAAGQFFPLTVVPVVVKSK